MNIFIKVKNVDVETVGEGKKTYQVAEVFYDTQQYKNQAHKVFSFVNPTVFSVISKASKGDSFNVEVSKNAKGYNQWDSISADGDDTSTVSTSTAPTRSAASTSSPGRTYETSEERDARQRLIVRQSSLERAMDYAKYRDKETGTWDEDEILTQADRFTDWVFEKVDLFDQPNDSLE